MHRYEMMFIIRPDLADDEIEKLVTQMEGYATAAGGKVEKSEKMGRRRLAYRVEKYKEGFYVLFSLEGEPGVVAELERRMRVADSVMKFLTIRIDAQQKRGAKLAAIRAQKETRRRKQPSAPSVAPVPE